MTYVGVREGGVKDEEEAEKFEKERRVKHRLMREEEEEGGVESWCWGREAGGERKQVLRREDGESSDAEEVKLKKIT